MSQSPAGNCKKDISFPSNRLQLGTTVNHPYQCQKENMHSTKFSSICCRSSPRTPDVKEPSACGKMMLQPATWASDHPLQPPLEKKPADLLPRLVQCPCKKNHMQKPSESRGGAGRSWTALQLGQKEHVVVSNARSLDHSKPNVGDLVLRRRTCTPSEDHEDTFDSLGFTPNRATSCQSSVTKMFGARTLPSNFVTFSGVVTVLLRRSLKNVVNLVNA